MRELISVLLLAVSFLLSSCATIPQSSLVEFSEAVSLTAENNISAYAGIEKMHHDVEVMKVVVQFDARGFKPESITPFFDEDSLKVRSQVLDGLCLYAKNLSGLSGPEQLGEFDAATMKLGKSLENLGEGMMRSSFFKDVKVESSQVQIFTTAVNAVGRWIIEYRKDKAIRENIVAMDGNIREICGLFIKDFGSPPDGVSGNPEGLRAQQWNQYDELMLLQDRFIRDNRSRLDPSARRQEIEKLASLPGKRKDADSALAGIQDSFMNLQKAHSVLASKARAGNGDFEGNLKKLMAEGKRISKFYKELRKED